MRRKIVDKLYDGIIALFLSIVGIIMIVPLLSVLATSLSKSIAVEAGKVFLLPVDITLASWRYILLRADLWRSFGVTFLATVIGTTLALIITAFLAYPLSKKYFALAKILGVFVIITMIFKAPIIPYFLTIKNLGLFDNFFVLVLPHTVTAYNLVIMRSFFSQLPADLEESAKIDGAGYFKIFWRILLPMSKPVMATLGLFYSVMIWNQFLHPILFIQNQALFPLQLRLRQYITAGEDLVNSSITELLDYNDVTLKSATIIFAVVPILMVYPYIQKYFVKGAMLGSVKG